MPKTDVISTEDDNVAPRRMPRWFGAPATASKVIADRIVGDDVPSIIFHYTSTTAFCSIVQNNELWLSDAKFLNDRAEIEHGRNIVCDCLKRALVKEQRPGVTAMLKRALENFGYKDDPKVYVVCFSLEGDDLGQWRGYGQAAAPVSIGFKVGPLLFGYTSEGILQKIIYDDATKIWLFDYIIEVFSNALDEDIRNPVTFERKVSPEKESEICSDRLYHSLWSYIVACKDAAFRSEREVRFLYIAHDFSRCGMGWYPQHPQEMFRERGGKIVPFLSSKSLNFSNMEPVGQTPKLPIRSVCIGPMPDKDLIERGLRRLLDAHGHQSAVITHSTTPFRR